MNKTTCNNQEDLNIYQLSACIGVSDSTLRHWERVLSINVHRNNKGNRLYSPDTVNIFFEIKKLLATGKNLDEIKELLNQDFTSCNAGYNNQPKIEIIQESEQQNFDLALVDKYESRIMELSREKENLNRTLGRLEGELSKFNEIITLKDSLITDKDKQLHAKDSEIEEYRAKLAKYENKPWWHVWR